MKTFRTFTAAILALATAALPLSAAAANPNPYDTFAKVLMPFVHALAKKSSTQEKAFTAVLELENAAGGPEALKNARLEIAFQAPNRLKLKGPVLGEEVTICRKGQKLWASPGPKIEALIASASEGRALPPADPDFKLAPFSLPFPEKQLVFLPALFRVTAAGDEVLAGETYRVLDVQLMPELERSMKGARGWTARLWIKPDGKPARIQVTGPEVSVTVRVAQLEFVRELPKATWSPAEGEEVLEIPPSRFDQLVRALIDGGLPLSDAQRGTGSTGRSRR